MPNPSAGEVRWTSEGPVARITIKGKKRDTFPLSTCKTQEDAEERCGVVARLAASFRKAGVIETPRAIELLRMAASEPPAMLKGVLEVASEHAGARLTDRSTSTKPTFRELAGDWTSGKLHELYKDHVKAKDSAQDKRRLEYLMNLDLGGIKLGEIRLDAFKLDHAEAAMRQLPEDAKRPGTRRHYAQVISRVLALAVYPCRHITVSPLPRGFMPKVGKPPEFPYLYPDEDQKLLAHTDIPTAYRMLWGFLAREGLRVSEALNLRFGVDLDLERGVITLDENKTDDPRAWKLDDGVVAALQRWKELLGAGSGAWVFPEENGGPIDDEHLADRLRAHLELAKVDRRQLLVAGTNRGRMRVHDLRGTFVTLSLANGKSETWVSDRTGHTSSVMINRYRRGARSAAELGLGSLMPLVDAIPELRESEGEGPVIAPKITWPLGGMADAGDLKSFDRKIVPVRVREGPPKRFTRVYDTTR